MQPRSQSLTCLISQAAVCTAWAARPSRRCRESSWCCCTNSGCRCRVQLLSATPDGTRASQFAIARRARHLHGAPFQPLDARESGQLPARPVGEGSRGETAEPRQAGRGAAWQCDKSKKSVHKAYVIYGTSKDSGAERRTQEYSVLGTEKEPRRSSQLPAAASLSGISRVSWKKYSRDTRRSFTWSTRRGSVNGGLCDLPETNQRTAHPFQTDELQNRPDRLDCTTGRDGRRSEQRIG